MTVSFVFLNTLSMEVPLDREIPLEKALLLLERQNTIAIENQLTMNFAYVLRENGVDIYESAVDFPKKDFSLYKVIYEEVEAQDFDGKEAFLKWLSSSFNQKSKKPKKEKQIKEKTSRRLPVISRKMLVAFFILIILLIVAGTGIYHFSKESSVPEKISFESLLKEDKFLLAAEEYPDKIAHIENELFELARTKDKKYLEDLTVFQEHFPTDIGEFDMAIFSFDYEKTVTIFEENETVFQEDITRLTLAGYAYLKLDQLDKSKVLLNQSKSAELEKLIRQYEQLQLIVEEKEREIKELQKEPTENKKRIEQAINDLYEAKEELSNF